MASPQPSAAAPQFAALVLAGGRARRLGGADKPALQVGDRSLAAAVTGACVQAGASQLILVGPPRGSLAAELSCCPIPVEFTSEDPPGAGPIPALRAGLTLVAAPWLLLLAADLPFLTGRLLAELASSARPTSGAVLVDDRGNPQWLTSCWRTAALTAALAAYQGGSLRGLLAPLPHVVRAIQVPPGEPPYWLDCDTPSDLAAAVEWSALSSQGGP